MILSRRWSVFALALFGVLLSFPIFAQSSSSPAPWDQPAFSVEPKALLAAAEGVSAGDSSLVVLLDERDHSFEANGRSHTKWRLMYRIVAEAAVTAMGQVQAPWSPWVHDRPTIEARVVSSDGSAHVLDSKAIIEAPGLDESLDIFSDNRVLRAPLPGIGVGAVVEYVISYDGNSPIAEAGMSDTFYLGRGIPVQRARLTIETPAAMEPRIVNTTELKAVVSEADGRRRMVFESGRIEAIKEFEAYLPFDVSPLPYIGFSTGSSWGDIAKRYSAIVDQQIAGSDLKKITRDAVGKATDKREVIARVLAAIQKEIRYAGVEVGEGSIIPRTPLTVLGNKYGDCKDKATLLVAMLREAGITAHVALLRAGSDFDVQPELPGIGRFNHAIVVVDGSPAIWVDPTDEFSRAAEMPIQDQGRMALVASTKTTALTPVPESPSTVNRISETRTFVLPEDGKAHVVETTEATGTHESWQRRYFASSEQARYRESMEEYAKAYYFAKALEKMDASDPRDLTKPFRFSLEVKESGSGIVSRGEAEVALHPAGLVTFMPEPLQSWREPGPNDDPEKVAKKRVHDFFFPAPTVKEWTYRITPPAGFTARTLPQNETKQLGTTTLTTEYAAQADGVVVAKVRFDSGKRRLSPAEFEETRMAISKLLTTDRIRIGFDSIGQSKLNAGDVGGALTEFNRLAGLHPKEAQHHLELARTLLAGGLGDAARTEVRRALEIEPANYRAHEMLAVALQHDLLGRPYHKGFDRDGAIAAYRKAKELEPKNAQIRGALAKLLSYGEEGRQFGRDARLEESIAEYRSLIADLGSEGTGYEPELMLVLTRAGRFAEVKELVKTMASPQQRDLGRIMAIAATDGPAVALRELGAFDASTRRSYSAAVGQTLMILRKYPEAAAMFEASSQGTADAAQMRTLLDTLHKAKRLEEIKVDANDPSAIIYKLLSLMATSDYAAANQLVAPDVLAIMEKKEGEEERSPFARLFGNADNDADLPPVVAVDLVASSMEIQKDGDEKTGYRLRVRMGGEEDELTFFVTRENGAWALRGFGNGPDSLGWSALRFAQAGELDRARTWLNWVREDTQARGGDDPLTGPSFPLLWSKEKSAATLDEIRLAAASLMLHDGTKSSEPILVEMREKVTDNAIKARIDMALAVMYSMKKEWKTAVPIAARLYAAYPDSSTAFMTYTSALAHGGQTAEAEKVAKQRLEKMPRDRDTYRALSMNAAEAGNWDAAQSWVQQVIEKLSPERLDYNNAAWYALFTNKDYDRALEQARKASEKMDASALHTLAALYAETGKSIEARDALFRSMSRRGNSDPTGIDWYVLGRIAENYGIRDAALAAYAKATNLDEDDETVNVLTDRRLAVLRK
jgi:tetratricopeptide (TPR) repeat protein